MAYKINYKALDKEVELTRFGYYPYKNNQDQWKDKFNKLKASLTKLVKENYDFLDNNYSNLILDDQGSPTFMVSYKHKGLEQMVWVRWSHDDPNEIRAYKTKVINDMTPFYDRELEWLDNNNIPVDTRHSSLFNQQPEDWFMNKAEDETMEPVDVVDEEQDPVYVGHSKIYNFYENHKVYHLYKTEKTRYDSLSNEFSYHYTKNLEADITSLYPGQEYDFEVTANFDDMIVCKQDSRTFHKFHNDELEFFDGLGFETSKEHKSYTGQDIEDWFGDRDES